MTRKWSHPCNDSKALVGKKPVWVALPVTRMTSTIRVSVDTENGPGNPWFLCTLWLAEW